MRIIIHTLKGIKIIDTKNIIFLKAYRNYTEFTILNPTMANHKDIIISPKSLKENELHLPKIEFYRCHKSYIINMLYFFEYDTSRDIIILEDGTEIKISRERKAEAKEKLFKFLEFFNN